MPTGRRPARPPTAPFNKLSAKLLTSPDRPARIARSTLPSLQFGQPRRFARDRPPHPYQSESARLRLPPSGRNRTICDRERIVGNCRAGLVPIRINSEWGGGSSSVFSRQFALDALKWSASSIIATRRPPRNGLSEMRWHSPSWFRCSIVADEQRDRQFRLVRAAGQRPPGPDDCRPRTTGTTRTRRMPPAQHPSCR